MVSDEDLELRIKEFERAAVAKAMAQIESTRASQRDRSLMSDEDLEQSIQEHIEKINGKPTR